MFHPRRTKCCTGTEDREVPSPEAGLEKSCTWGQLNPGRVGFTEAETGKSIPDRDLRQGMSRERRLVWPELRKQEQGCRGVRSSRRV